MAKGKVRPEDIRVGENLKRLRQERGLSLEDIGKELKVSYQQVMKYERGENRISAGLLGELSYVLDVDINEFFEV